jgi:hypothetical protein
MEALEQVAPVELDRVGEPASVERFLERDRVAPQMSRRETECVAAAENDVRTERAAKNVERLAQRVAGVLGVVLGPEEREERVPTVRPAPRGERQITEEGYSLGLREDRSQLLPIGAAESERSKCAQPDHMT